MGKKVKLFAAFSGSADLTFPQRVCIDVEGSSLGGYVQTGNFECRTWSGVEMMLYVNPSDNALPNTIGITQEELTWKYKVVTGTNQWIEMEDKTGPHKIYRVGAAPLAPMSPPWAGVLDIACGAAEGASTAASALRLLHYRFYDNSGALYDVNEAKARYIYGGNFCLSNMIGNWGSLGLVNCYDMAQGLMVFSRALGCDVGHWAVAPFGHINCSKPVGRGWTNNPCYGDPNYCSNPIVPGDWGAADGRSHFDQHSFVVFDYNIYDPTLGIVDMDEIPDAAPHIGYYLDGYDTWLAHYKVLTIDTDPQWTTPGVPGAWPILNPL